MLSAVAAILGFVAVAAGAFGAHGLEGRLDPKQTGWWETATQYLLAHAIIAYVTAALGLSPTAGWCFVAGAILFSGTLYAMALGGPGFLGAVTPLGGLLLLGGWGLLVVRAFLSRPPI